MKNNELLWQANLIYFACSLFSDAVDNLDYNLQA